MKKKNFILHNKGTVYVDVHGKQWDFIGAAQENSEEFRQLRLRHCLFVHNTWTNTIGLDCMIRGDSARIRQIPNCPFRGLFMRGTGRFYIRGEHNHPMGPDGAVRFKQFGGLTINNPSYVNLSFVQLRYPTPSFYLQMHIRVTHITVSVSAWPISAPAPGSDFFKFSLRLRPSAPAPGSGLSKF